MRMKFKIKGKPFYLAETVSLGIDYSLEWNTYERLSTQDQREGHFLQILWRLAQLARRHGMVEMARHLGLTENQFDVSEVVHGASLDRHLNLDGTETTSLQWITRWAEDLALVGIMLPVSDESAEDTDIK